MAENKFRMTKSSIVDVLNEIERFENKMSIINEKYAKYDYDINIDRDEQSNKWIVELKVKRDEPEDIEVS